jgi:hypothetical protein
MSQLLQFKFFLISNLKDSYQFQFQLNYLIIWALSSHNQLWFNAEISKAFAVNVYNSSIFCNIMLCSPLKENRRVRWRFLDVFRIKELPKQGAGSKESNTLCRKLGVHVRNSWEPQGTSLLPLCFLYKHNFPQSDCSLCYLLHYSLTLKMEVTHSSETSVDFQRTTLCYIPEHRLFITTAEKTSNPI